MSVPDDRENNVRKGNDRPGAEGAPCEVERPFVHPRDQGVYTFRWLKCFDDRSCEEACGAEATVVGMDAEVEPIGGMDPGSMELDALARTSGDADDPIAGPGTEDDGLFVDRRTSMECGTTKVEREFTSLRARAFERDGLFAVPGCIRPTERGMVSSSAKCRQ